MSPNDYNQRFYYLVRSESFYAKRLSAMNEEICEAFLNISKFLIDEGYVSNAREVDNIVEALPEQALANMFDDDTFATKFKIALKAVNPRLSENALSGEKRQAAAIALRLLEYSKNNATYLKPGSKAPEKDKEGAAGEYNPRGSEKKAKGGSGAVNAALKGKVSQTEEVEQVDENRAAMGRINKEYHRKKEADEMAARTRDPKVKRDLPKRKNDNPMYDPKSAGSSRVKDFKFTPVKEESEQIDEIAPVVAKVAMGAAKMGAKALAANAMKKKPEQQPTAEETEVEEGYKAIDKKKETAMYRRAGNLARTSLASKGKKKEEAQTKSANIVSAISSQKEKERFSKMADEKARDNYNEETVSEADMTGAPSIKDAKPAKKTNVKYYKGMGYAPTVKKEEIEPVSEEEGKKDACYHKVKSRYSVWPSAYASGALVKCRKKGADNWGNSSKKEGFDIDHLLNDDIFDELTEEELLHFAFDIFEEMEQEGILTEAVEYFDDVLLEDRYASAVAQSKANARSIRRDKVVGALKKAGSAIKSAGSAAAGRAKEMAKRAAPAIKKGAQTAGKAVSAAARGGASLAKKAAVKGAAAAGEVAGAAKGGYEAGRIKAKRQAMSQTKPQSKPASSSSSSDDGTKGKLDGLLKDVRGGSSKPASSSSSSSGGSSGGGSSSGGSSSGGSSSGDSTASSGTATRKRGLLRRVGSAIKSGLKKAVGKTARGISNVSGAAASRLGEDTEFDIVLDYLLEYDVCTLDDAEEVMMELTDEEITNILDENRAAARAAGGYKDDSKKQTDPSKDGFTGISGSIKEIMRQNKEIEAKNKKK
jgi:uncharacterized membrane protein YgcG